jgi:hypothetical protein
VYELSEGQPMLLVGSTSMPLFSSKGRLKTGQQRLQVRAAQLSQWAHTDVLLTSPGQQLQHAR